MEALTLALQGCEAVFLVPWLFDVAVGGCDFCFCAIVAVVGLLLCLMLVFNWLCIVVIFGLEQMIGFGFGVMVVSDVAFGVFALSF